MSKITIVDNAYNFNIEVGDIVASNNNILIVTEAKLSTFSGVIIASRTTSIGSIGYNLDKSDYRKFKGTIMVE